MNEKPICSICGEPIEFGDMATYARPDGAEDFCPEPAHAWCVDSREEAMHRDPSDAFDEAENRMEDR